MENKNQNAFKNYQNVSLTDDNLNSMLWGLGITASGGGGGFEIGQLLINNMQKIEIEKRVLKPVSEAPDGDWLVMAGGIGKPTSLTEENIAKFVDYVEGAITKWEELQTKKIGKPVKVAGLLPVEAGPVNGLMAMYIGWSLGLDVYDCDGAGRAVPSLFNLTYDYSGYPVAPVVLSGDVNEKRLTVEVTKAGVEPKNGTEAEADIGTYPFFDTSKGGGGAAGLVCWGQTGEQLKGSEVKVIENTFSKLIPIGQKIYSNKGDSYVLENYLKETFYSAQFARLGNITEKSDGRHDFNTISIGDDPVFPPAIITNENENLLFMNELPQKVLATAPSIIAFLFYDKKKKYFIPYNLGDEALTKHLADFRDVGLFVIVAEVSKTLFEGGLGDSFHAVLKESPFNYTGPFEPASR
jgi:hypothetical protein